MLTDYSLKMPKEVYGGEHALEKLKDVMSVNDVKKVAVFTDHGIRGTGLLELPMQMLTQAGVETVILDDLPAEPTYSQVQVLVDAFRAEKAGYHRRRRRRQRHGCGKACLHSLDRPLQRA